jgi:hypothetical protein
MQIKNVRWGLKGEPVGQPCLYFDLDGRPASAFWEQKQGVFNSGHLFIDFEDDLPSHLPVRKLTDADGHVNAKSDQFIHSPWLCEKLTEMCDARPFENGRAVGDAPLVEA